MADDLNPITRTETFLAGNEPDLTPITREEVILAGGDLDPITRKEWFLKKYRGGGGSSITVEPLTVTQNGTNTAPSGKAYSPVTVNVPQPSGVKNITISQNGTTTENVANYASASIAVNVPSENPNSYELVSGTLSNPWGTVNPSTLMGLMKADSGFGSSTANVYLSVTIPNMGVFTLPVALDNWDNPSAFVASGLNYAPALGASTPQGGCLIYGANGALLSAYMYVNGTLTDVASQMGQAPTDLRIFMHPLD